MTESDGYETVYVTGWARRDLKPAKLRTRLSDDQARAAWERWSGGASISSIAIRFRATHQAVQSAIESIVFRDDSDPGEAA